MICYWCFAGDHAQCEVRRPHAEASIKMPCRCPICEEQTERAPVSAPTKEAAR